MGINDFLLVLQSIVPASDEDEEAEVKPAASKPKPAKKSAKSKRVDSDEEVGLISVATLVLPYQPAQGIWCG